MATKAKNSKKTTYNLYKKRSTGVGMTSMRAGKEVSFSIWLCLPIGMYAVAHRWTDDKDWNQATDERDIMVRARKRKYLDRLRRQFIPELGPDVGRDGKGTDYGHRAYVKADDLARGLARMAMRVDSPSFKEHALDDDLHSVYMSIWSAAVKLDDNSPYAWKGNGTHAAGGWYQTPMTNHKPKPEDCLRMGYHWFQTKDGNAACVDCGAERTVITATAKMTYRYTYPAGSVILHTQDGKKLGEKEWRRVPGTPPVKSAPHGGQLTLPDTATATTSYGLGYPTTTTSPPFPGTVMGPTTTSRAYPHTPAEDTGPGECLSFSDHWWTGPGTAICRDCGAGRYLDSESGSLKYTHPAGSAMLTDADGEPIDDPHIVTDADAPEDTEEAQDTEHGAELEIYVPAS